MARDYRSSESWDNDAAKRWWEMHLLELTGPLTMSDARPDVAERAAAVH